ncbi:unnamed protein product [Orchesella dallaii]|uniref:Uncharacterized protein n=1 Tax=Orchesella dallaii TaxID=48710 RepID=A0ABP1QDY5_9HEXA
MLTFHFIKSFRVEVRSLSSAYSIFDTTKFAVLKIFFFKMSEFLFSTAQLYFSESEQLETYIEDEIISPNVDALTTLTATLVVGILITILVKLHLNGNDNF